MSINLERLKYDGRGLIPAIVQDADTGAVLMMAYMNEESLRVSLDEGRTCFYSRARGALWRKGETSGNVQHIRSITADCDYDTLLITVEKAGPACHLGTETCFSYAIMGNPPMGEPPPWEGIRGKGPCGGAFDIDALFALIEARKRELPEGSYTTYLFEKGLEKILKKLGEESAEVIIAAMKGDTEETIYELGDLCYHALVLLCELGLTPAMVRAELEKRHIIDHKVKQERMG